LKSISTLRTLMAKRAAIDSTLNSLLAKRAVVDKQILAAEKKLITEAEAVEKASAKTAKKPAVKKHI